MVWLTAIRDAKTGADLYPKLRSILDTIDLEKVPLGYRFCTEMYRRFGYFASPADSHVADYAWCVDMDAEKRCKLSAFPVESWFGGRDANSWSQVANKVKDADAVRSFVKERRTGWMNTQIARYMLTGEYRYFPSVNVLNGGSIPNITPDVVVEIPGVIGPDFVKGLNMGPLPDQLVPICQLQGSLSNLIGDAAALGSKEIALQALLMDPFVASMTRAENILKDILEYNSQYDTRFNR
jgi:alpha-galactosidase